MVGVNLVEPTIACVGTMYPSARAVPVKARVDG
jgi:hypothetical protein